MTNNETPQEAAVPSNGFVMSPGLYAKMKFVALMLLPGLTTLYFTLGNIWDFPSVEQVIGTLTAFDTFLGVMIGVASNTYNKSDARFAGDIVLSTGADGSKLYSLELNGDPEDLDTMKEVTFKVGGGFPPPSV